METIRLIQGVLRSNKPQKRRERLVSVVRFSMAAMTLAIYTFSLMYVSFKAGYTSGIEDSEESQVSFTDQLKENKEFLNKVCYNWWFKTPPMQRQL